MTQRASLVVGVLGIGLLGPGLPSWAAGKSLLRDPASWQCTPTIVPPPTRLAPTERRRAGTAIKAAIVVADEACVMAGLDPAALATVFTSSTGDPAICHAMCEALATPARMVSPTRFTNSVHNAAAGYWHIATGCMQASTSLCALDASFAAGLLEATVQCLATGAPVLLVASDLPYPEPLNALRTVSDVFALALVLAPAGTAHVPTLGLASVPTMQVPSSCDHPALDKVRHTIPAARALPLLQVLARGESAQLSVEALAGTSLRLDVSAAR
jgi:Beta-ketoacyl synthase, N-terminal domain